MKTREQIQNLKDLPKSLSKDGERDFARSIWDKHFYECAHKISKKCERVVQKTGLEHEIYARCEPCEKEHKAWREGHSVFAPVQGSWSRYRQQELSANAKDTLQPLKEDGTINKHFVQAHGTKALQKELKVSKDVIRQNIEKYG